MNERRLSEAEIGSALRAHLPSHAQAGLPGRVIDAVGATSQQRPLPSFIGSLSDADATRRRTTLLIAAALVLGVALAGAAAVGAWRLLQPDTVPQLELAPPTDLQASPISNGWIAYSTTSGSHVADVIEPSEIFLVREGAEPRLIAGHERGTKRNVCPAFSPDGTRLAYGVVSNQGRAVVVLGVGVDGVVGEDASIAVPGTGPAVCPRWSSDGTRVAYLDGGIDVVRGLDGSTPADAAGDPSVTDLETYRDPALPLLSPSGDRTVRRPVGSPDCNLVIANTDGTAARVLAPRICPYAIAAWSPDGRQVLIIEDVGGFTIEAIDVDSLRAVTLAFDVQVNGARDWPGRGDVSWQPVLP